MSEGDDLQEKSQFIRAPSEVFVLQYVRDCFQIHLPQAMAHLSVQPQDRLQSLRETTLYEPLGVAPCPEEPSQISGHHIGRTPLSCSSESDEIGDFVI